MEKYARSHNFSALTVSNSEKIISIDIDTESDDPTLACTAAMWMCSSKIAKEIVLDSSTDWVNSLRGDRPAPSICKINVSIPDLAKFDLSGKSALESMLNTVRTFRASEYVSSGQVRWHWRPQRYPGRDEYYKKLCDHLGVDGLMPRVSKPTIDIGLVLPFATYGGAEKVAFALAKTLVRHGMRVHIFVIGDPCLTVIDEFHSSLTSINILAEKDFPKWGGPLTVFGQESFAPDSPEIRPSLLGGFLAGLDLVINCHAAPMNALINTAKGMGAKTATYLHVFDTTTLGRLVGHPYLTIPFEHGYDLILTCSEALKQELHALGVPEEKILSIPNAAGFRLQDNVREPVAKQRMTPRNNRRLRLLYLGRLDRQKGVDRLFNLVVALRNKVVPVDVRIIGSALLDAEENWVARFSSIGLEVENPIYETKDLQDAYIWADALLLPSRWEGAPLVIPECQQTGCIPIAMKVGAVEELIEDGVDGILIANGGEHQIITDYCIWIDTLINNDKLRMELSEKAFGRGAAATWDLNYGPFLAWLHKEFNLAFSAKTDFELSVSPEQNLDRTFSPEGDIEFAKELV
jgi:glycosyltransferase involved in cell wall biosynthesis